MPGSAFSETKKLNEDQKSEMSLSTRMDFIKKIQLGFWMLLMLPKAMVNVISSGGPPSENLPKNMGIVHCILDILERKRGRLPTSLAKHSRAINRLKKDYFEYLYAPTIKRAVPTPEGLESQNLDWIKLDNSFCSRYLRGHVPKQFQSFPGWEFHYLEIEGRAREARLVI